MNIKTITNNYEQEEVLVKTCSLCDDGIREGDSYWNIGGNVYCERCVNEGRQTV